jgi:hypothetical protein
MSVLNQVRQQIEQLPVGKLLTYREIPTAQQNIPMVVQALSILYRQGILKRLCKSIYYKPEPSEFGELRPSTLKILQKILDVQKHNVSYITGQYAYNSLKLSTQVAKEYLIATDKPRRTPLYLSGTTIRFVKSRISQPVSDVRLLQILDALTEIKTIPDGNITHSYQILKALIAKLKPSQCEEIVNLAFSYPPSTRALLGLILEQLNHQQLSLRLHKSLNPLSVYQIGLPPHLCSHQWRIQ